MLGVTSADNRVCATPIFISDVGVVPNACFIVEIRIDHSRQTDQPHGR